MEYIDESGQPIESPDLTLGYLEDAEWIDHEAIPEKYHFEYELIGDPPETPEDPEEPAPQDTRGQLQKYIVDSPYVPAWREVTVQRYIRYTQEEMEALQKLNYGARCDALEARCGALETYALNG